MTMATAATTDVSSSVTYAPPAAVTATAGAVAAPAGGSSMTFGELLSDLNPLQYLPVIGTIYRAVTGDTIPKDLREFGGVVVSGLIGGPIGLATSLASLGFQKLTGLDFEDIEQGMLTSLGAGASATPAATPAPASAPAPAAVAAPPAAIAIAPAAIPDPAAAAAVAEGQPWTKAQLAAYGVVTLKDGTLRQGDLTGADVLNALQLRRTAGELTAA